MNAIFPAAAVDEIQGLYGPFTFSENLLQQVWRRGDFASARAVTTDGRSLVILHPGRWNRLGGPDFMDARLRLGGREVIGDVELHLRAEGWAAHDHAADPAYDRVVLHVVLFPPGSAAAPVRSRSGAAIPTLVLISLLHRDLEEYAVDAAVEALASRDAPEELAELEQLPPEECAARLRTHAVQRWQQKLHFASLRIARLGWTEACHHTALDILGYRRNRAPMLKIAGTFPLAQWPQLNRSDLAELEAAYAGAWNTQGLRPANHPRTRLRQYLAWAQGRPGWPAQLEAEAAIRCGGAGEPGRPTGEVRRQLDLPALRTRLAQTLLAGAVGGSRLDNLFCDGFFPLLAARTREELFPLWFHWFPGDLPERVPAGLRLLRVTNGRTRPLCHGFAQGLLGWSLKQEAESRLNFNSEATKP
jgi:hypothetical protein